MNKNQVKWAQHYWKLCDRAKIRAIEGYSEKHHIIPKCMGGSNKADNLVRLTPEEHYVAHQLLVKMYPGNVKLICAAHMMANASPNNKLYGWIRRKISESWKGRKGIPRSAETRWKISEALKGRTAWNKGIPRSDEEKQKMSESAKGKVPSNETRQKMSESRRGKVFSEKTKQKMSAWQKGIPRSNETKLKISKAKKGKPNGWQNKTHSSEAKRKMSESAKRRYSAMKKIVIVSLLSLNVACASVGSIDAMNDIGLGQVSHGIRTVEKTQTVLGVPQQRSYLNTPSINRGYGEIKNFQSNDIPTTVRNVQEILRYLQ